MTKFTHLKCAVFHQGVQLLPCLHCSLLSARVDDFVGALKQLHVDFHWPFPVLSLSALQHVASGLSRDQL